MSEELHSIDELNQVFAEFDFSSFSIVDHCQRSDSELKEEPAQVTAQTVTYWQEEYAKATEEEKGRVIRRMATRIHETLHFHQLYLSTFGIWNQFDVVQRTSRFMMELVENNWLPGKSIMGHLTDVSKEHGHSPILCPADEIIRKASWGAYVQDMNSAKDRYRKLDFLSIRWVATKDVCGKHNSISFLTDVPFIELKLKGEWVPLGVKQIIEAWAFCVTRAILASTLSIEAGLIYEGMHSENPKYMVWDWLFEELAELNKAPEMDRFRWLSSISTILGFFSINGGSFDLDKIGFYPTTIEDFPGLRCADLICDLMASEPKGEYHLLELAVKRDSGFFSSPVFTARNILDYFGSGLLDEHWWKRETNLAIILHFALVSLQGAINIFQNTSMLFHFEDWYKGNEDYFYCPAFYIHSVKHSDETVEKAFRSPVFAIGNEQFEFYLDWFIINEIVRQRMYSTAAICPLVRFRGRCNGARGPECSIPFSGEPSIEILSKQCDFARTFRNGIDLWLKK